MCGIAGFQIFKNNLDIDCTKKIKEITEVINHRGPDSEGFWSCDKEQIYFGHKRLSIIDLSIKGKQPMISNNGRFIITYNGEIYNYKNLKKLLENKYGVKFKNKTDTQVILELISIFGLYEALQMMEGMFAFVLFDKQSKVVSLVRDRFGEKPLFYYIDNKYVVFSSELKSIKKFFNNTNLNISKIGIQNYKYLGYIPAPYSIYEKTYKILPSQIVNIKNGRIVDKLIYWNHSNNSNNIKTQFNLDSIESSIEASVKKMMVADVDVGCFLSGGIDSSLIAAMMQKNSPKKINTFTVGFYEQNYDESIYAKKISNYLNTNHFEIKVSINDMILNIRKIIENFDEPFADSSAVPTELISSLASQKTKVILSGDGGDEIFLGYNRYIYAKKLSFFKNISPVYVRAILQKIINILPLGFLDILSTPFQKAFGIQGFSHKLIKLSNILTYENNEQFYKKLNIIDNNFLNEFLKAKENFFSKYNDTNLLESVQKNDIDNYLCNDILTKVDRSSMLNSLEVRSPFLDHLLVEKMMKIPSKLKIKNNKLKIILKDILEKYVPKAYYDRPKMGFAIPLESWFDKEKMLNLSDELIYDTEWSQLFYDDKKVKKNWENYKNFKSFPAIKIWSYLVSAIWINKNI